jgi:formate dehydrogenase major subunit
LRRLDELVVQDLFLNETARELGTTFLPATCSFEKDGTFMNSERRIQRVRQAVDPPAGTRADWQIIRDVAAAMNRANGFMYDEPSEIWDEIRRVWTPGAGITYERLDQPGGLQWPCPDEQHPGTRILHDHGFPIGRASLARVAPRASEEEPSIDYPLTLITGRALYQFNAGTMTRRSATQALRVTDWLEISSVDAQNLGLETGSRVRVESRYGHAELPVEISTRVSPGCVFASFSDPAVRLNELTGPHRDPYTHTPEYKVTAVRVKPLSTGGAAAPE